MTHETKFGMTGLQEYFIVWRLQNADKQGDTGPHRVKNGVFAVMLEYTISLKTIILNSSKKL
jgi:hypothetical protein